MREWVLAFVLVIRSFLELEKHFDGEIFIQNRQNNDSRPLIMDPVYWMGGFRFKRVLPNTTDGISACACVRRHQVHASSSSPAGARSLFYWRSSTLICRGHTLSGLLSIRLSLFILKRMSCLSGLLARTRYTRRSLKEVESSVCEISQHDKSKLLAVGLSSYKMNSLPLES